MDPAHLGTLIEVVGTDSLLFVSADPHWDVDHPSELDAHLRRRFGPEDRSAVLHGNAAEVFGLAE